MRCPVAMCDCEVLAQQFMCPLHWGLVPYGLRLRVLLSQDRVEAVRSVNAILGGVRDG